MDADISVVNFPRSHIFIPFGTRARRIYKCPKCIKLHRGAHIWMIRTIQNDYIQSPVAYPQILLQ